MMSVTTMTMTMMTMTMMEVVLLYWLYSPSDSILEKIGRVQKECGGDVVIFDLNFLMYCLRLALFLLVRPGGMGRLCVDEQQRLCCV